MKMLNKIIFGKIFLATSLLFASNFDLKYNGEEIIFQSPEDDEPKEYIINRVHDESCRGINGNDPKVVWGGDYANSSVNKVCTKTFITNLGKITPMKITEKIKTLGEIEVIEFMKDSQTNKDKILIDARLPDWYLDRTIPTAQNIPFTYFDPKKYPDDFFDVLETIGVTIDDNGKYNFSQAKELLLFCNGAWCPQSTFAIENLIAIGYPEEKMSWYRGGMYSWTMLNLTTVKP